MSRNFEMKPAVRSAVPVLIGLEGPSGGGKTFTALRLATGIQRVFPGPIIGIDTESKRMLHYADKFNFEHIEFKAPFGSLDYLEVIQFAASKKPSVIIVDSASHEHEGPGGLLDFQAKELDRMAGDDYRKRMSMQMLAWKEPKQARRKLINGILQINTNFIFCFRAKESSRPAKDKETGKSIIENFGFMPIAGDEFVFEMTINCLLLPHANGIPTWQSDHKGEKMMMKLPDQFKHIFNREGIQLDESIGEKLAIWARGDQIKPQVKPDVSTTDTSSEFELTSDPAESESPPILEQWELALEDNQAGRSIIAWGYTQDKDIQNEIDRLLTQAEDMGDVNIGITRAMFLHPDIVGKKMKESDFTANYHFNNTIVPNGNAEEIREFTEKIFHIFMRVTA